MSDIPKEHSGIIKNNTMLAEERESIQARAQRLLATDGYIGVCKQSISHIYATIIEIAFPYTWKSDFITLEQFRTHIGLDKDGCPTEVDLEDFSETYKGREEMRYDQIDTIAKLLKQYRVGPKQIHDILNSILEGTGYRNWPIGCSGYEKAQD